MNLRRNSSSSSHYNTQKINYKNQPEDASLTTRVTPNLRQSRGFSTEILSNKNLNKTQNHWALFAAIEENKV